MSDPAAEEYGRRLRELLVACLDLRRVRQITDGAQLRRDLVLVTEHLHDRHPAALGPAGADAAAVRAAAADDVAECVEQGHWDRLKPTPWATRVVFDWWYEMTWVGRAWHAVRWRVLVPAWELLWFWHRPRK